MTGRFGPLPGPPDPRGSFRASSGSVKGMSDGRRRLTDEDFVDAAVAMVDRYGSADPGLGYTMVAAAEVAGIGRQALYNHWASITDLTAAIAVHSSMTRPGWRHRLLETEPDASLASALRQALAEPDLAPVIRAIVSAWPLDNPARRALIEWEQAWFAVAARWLESRVAGEGRSFGEGGDAELFAIVATAWADGCYFMANWLTGPTLPDWAEPDVVEHDYEMGLAWLDRVLPVGEGGPVRSDVVEEFSMPPAPEPALGAAQRAIIDALLDATGAPPSDDRPRPTPGRLVDLARLARELGVSERSLYNRWPQVNDLNADVLEHVLVRARRESEERAALALKVCWERQFTSYDDLIISGIGALIDATADRAPFTHFAMVVASLDDAVREPSAAFVREWVDSLATSFLAMFAVSGWRLEDEVSIRKLMMPMFSTVLGLQRIACMHPDLASSTRTFRGREVPALAYGIYLFLMGGITDAPFVRDAGEEPAPALADVVDPEGNGLAS